jgi:hypothetical protein
MQRLVEMLGTVPDHKQNKANLKFFLFSSVACFYTEADTSGMT